MRNIETYKTWLRVANDQIALFSLLKVKARDAEIFARMDRIAYANHVDAQGCKGAARTAQRRKLARLLATEIAHGSAHIHYTMKVRTARNASRHADRLISRALSAESCTHTERTRYNCCHAPKDMGHMFGCPNSPENEGGES